MKPPKLVIKLPSFLKKLWPRQPLAHLTGDGRVTRRSAATSEVDSEVAERFMLAAFEIQSGPSTRIESRFSCLCTDYCCSVFQLPDELFLEVFTHFPVLKWSDLYYRYNHAWYTPIPDVYGERIQALVALSATCRAMRYRFLPEVWERSITCLRRWRRSEQIPSRLYLQCQTLLNNRSLASYVKLVSLFQCSVTLFRSFYL